MPEQNHVVLTECPRDAYQGFPRFIPTREKVAYIDRLIDAGVHRIDFGSFVSPKVVPQMRDTAALSPEDDGAAVFCNIASPENVYLIGIVANLRGAQGLVDCNQRAGGDGRRIDAAGYPMSVNETFQKRNTNRDLAKAWKELKAIAGLCAEAGVDLIGYLSMAFGNPYGEPQDSQQVVDFAGRLCDLGAATIQIADTVGVAEPDQVAEIYLRVRSAVNADVGVHLHARPERLRDTVVAALEAGCRLFDSAIGGIGGCPFSGSELVGNIDTLPLLDLLHELGYRTDYDSTDLQECAQIADDLKRKYG